jgi:PAS domain S-box-containing protein
MAAERDVILDSINEGVFTVDLDWRISSFNRAAEKITGISRKDALGHKCADVFHANICESKCALKRTFESGKPVVNATAHIITNSGQRIPIRLSTAVLKNKKGKIIGGVETFQDLTQLEELRKQLYKRHTFEDIVGLSPAMMKIFDVLPQIAESASTVLIEGESGTGKELFAKAIHNLSPRKKRKFIAVNCAALPDSLLESELFGYKAGAFTDAKKDKPGRFLLADGGTIFLDEIGDISPALQVRLLRVLQERVIEPLGGISPVPVNVRVIAATNKNLQKQVKSGLFREDLYYRIKVIHLKLPKLKERRQDIPLLVDHLIAKFNHLQDKNIELVAPEAMHQLINHDYPGNIRELENIIEQAFVLCRGNIIEVKHLPVEMQPEINTNSDFFPPMSLQSMEKRLIIETLQRRQGNRLKTAKELDINPSTLYRKMKAFSITLPQTDGRNKIK